jgi:hypothetical protein
MNTTLEKMLSIAVAVITVLAVLYGVGLKTAKDNTISISNTVDAGVSQITK